MAKSGNKKTFKERFSEKALRIADRIMSGKEVIYDEAIHIPLLLELFMVGGNVCNFCCEAEMSDTCFYNWLKRYKNFNSAYEVAKRLAHAHWEGPAKLQTDNKIWTLIMKNRFGYTEQRKLEISSLKAAQKFAEQYGVIVTEISKGTLTGPEAQQLTNIIATGADIDEKTKLRDEFEEFKKSLGK